jgi:hypothetical protein
MNTAFIIWIIKPKADMLTENYIEQISKILWADAFTAPIVMLLGIPEKIAHYVIAPMSKSQLKMNSYFLGKHLTSPCANCAVLVWYTWSDTAHTGIMH